MENMTFDDCLERCMQHVNGNEVSNTEDFWEQLNLLSQCLPLGCQRQTQNPKLSCAYQALLQVVLNTEILSEYGVSISKSKVIDLIFLRALHVDSYLVLVAYVKDAGPSSKLEAVLTLLSKFFTDVSFEEMCKDQCCVNSNEAKVKSAWKPLWEQMITLIVSLPNRIHNKNLQSTYPTFETQTFCNIMSKALISSLEYVHNELKSDHSCTLEYQSLLLGRLFLAGYGDNIFKSLIPNMLPLLQSYLWKKVVQRLILGISEKYLEPVISSLLCHISWYGHTDCFIGNGGVDNNTIKYLMTKKMILIRFFEKPNVLFKCIGYYSLSPNRHNILLTVFENILDIWSKRSALKHQSEPQHLYLSCGVMVCGAFLPSTQFGHRKSALMKYLLHGVQAHIESSCHSVRIQGMVIGQTISSILDPEGPKMAFEFEECDESKLLISLLSLPQRLDENENKTTEKEVVKYIENLSNELPEIVKGEPLDSDDDLEPFDQSNDTVFHKEKTPLYVQDIIAGLADNSEPNYSNLCLHMAEKIIRAQPHYTISVSKELIKILLHLEDTFAADSFIQLRFKAMVAVTEISPEIVSKYLTDQFYYKDYNIRQRLDILEVLATTSQELSKLKLDCKADTILQPKISVTRSELHQEHWSEIIQRRIDSKTRRFGKGHSKEVTKPVANKFANVAGLFFFPLLTHYDNPQNNFDLLGEDSYVLGRLIYTLGIICNSSVNTPVFRQIAKSMLEFIWTLRYHVDVFVRQALLFSFCMIVVNSSHYLLSGDLQSEILECQLWLQDILEKDPNKECQKCAGKALTLLYQMLKNE